MPFDIAWCRPSLCLSLCLCFVRAAHSESSRKMDAAEGSCSQPCPCSSMAGAVKSYELAQKLMPAVVPLSATRSL